MGRTQTVIAALVLAGLAACRPGESRRAVAEPKPGAPAAKGAAAAPASETEPEPPAAKGAAAAPASETKPEPPAPPSPPPPAQVERLLVPGDLVASDRPIDRRHAAGDGVHAGHVLERERVPPHVPRGSSKAGRRGRDRGRSAVRSRGLPDVLLGHRAPARARRGCPRGGGPRGDPTRGHHARRLLAGRPARGADGAALARPLRADRPHRRADRSVTEEPRASTRRRDDVVRSRRAGADEAGGAGVGTRRYSGDVLRDARMHPRERHRRRAHLRRDVRLAPRQRTSARSTSSRGADSSDLRRRDVAAGLRDA